ncbi:MAG: glutamine-hydrolyzing GMP synthase [Pseudomonadota bacterium]
MLQEQVETVVVLDYGGQYTHLVAKAVRGLGVYSRIEQPEAFDPASEPNLVGIILSGGPSSVYDPGAPGLPFDPIRLPVPVLGLCYGHQLLARASGGEVRGGGLGEYGLAQVRCAPGALFDGLPSEQPVWMSHRDRVERLPAGWRATASTPTLPVAAFESADQRIFGLQFHPEVSHTRHGRDILERFLGRCTARRDWDPGHYAALLSAQVRQQVGEREVFLLVSGGVDSLVTLVLLIRALGPERVHSLHVDTGFMRLGESADIMRYLRELGFANLHLERAEGRYLAALEGVVEPEHKRRIIGRLFVEVVDDAVRALRLGEGWLLAQGTIYPDSIESGATAKADLIKTHHNRVDEIQRLIAAGRVVEPLLDLYKHEVRELGMQLGLPRDLVDRHPFPGPALAIRALCSADAAPPGGYDADLDALQDIAARYGLAACVLPVRSVGVQGDSRTYRHPAALWYPDDRAPDWEVLLACAAEVVNRLPSLNRAVFAPGGADPSTLRLVPTFLDRPGMDLLRQVDHLTHTRTAHLGEIWQMPVVSLPLVEASGQRAFVLRPVTSRDAMTADVFRMPADLLAALQAEVAAIPGAGMLLYDLTTKPPGTIEWE